MAHASPGGALTWQIVRMTLRARTKSTGFTPEKQGRTWNHQPPKKYANAAERRPMPNVQSQSLLLVSRGR